MTDRAFENLGLSRLAEECTFDMEPLEEEEERQVIKDWQGKEGKAKGDTAEWVDTISQETHRWPDIFTPTQQVLRMYSSKAGAR